MTKKLPAYQRHNVLKIIPTKFLHAQIHQLASFGHVQLQSLFMGTNKYTVTMRVRAILTSHH